MSDGTWIEPANLGFYQLPTHNAFGQWTYTAPSGDPLPVTTPATGLFVPPWLDMALHIEIQQPKPLNRKERRAREARLRPLLRKLNAISRGRGK